MNESWDFDLNAPESLFQQGMDMLECDHFEEALHAFDRLLDSQPQHADALFHRGVSLIHLGRPDEARRAFEQAVKLSPTESQYRSHLGYALMLTGDPKGALAEFEYALIIAPDAYQNRVYKACVMAEMGQLDSASEILCDVIENYPDDLDARRHFGNVLEAQGRVDEACEQFLWILKRNPNQLDCIRKLGLLYLSTGSTANAKARLHEYLALAPQDTQIWGALVRLCYFEDDYASVLALHDEATQEGIESAEVLHHAGMVHFEEDRWVQAYSCYTRARRLNPKDAALHYSIARLLSQQGRYRSASASVSRALSFDSDNPTYLHFKAALHGKLGEVEAEVQILEMLLLKAPTEFPLVQLTATKHARRNNLSEAIRVAERYVSHCPRDIDGVLLAANLRERAGDSAGALRHYRTLERRSSVPAYAHAEYAAFLFRASDFLHGLKLLDVALKRHPNATALRLLQATALSSLDRHEESLAALANLKFEDVTTQVLGIRARSLQALRRHDELLACLRLWRKSLPENDSPDTVAGILFAEAQCLRDLNRTDEALEVVRRPELASSDHALAAVYLASEMLETAKAYREALEECKVGLALADSDETLHCRVARCAAHLGDRVLLVHHATLAVSLNEQNAIALASDPKIAKLSWYPKVARALRYENFKDARLIWALLAVGFSLIAVSRALTQL